MGVNILNMGVIGGFVGFYSFHGLMKVTKNISLSAGPAAWLACFVPAEVCAVEMFFAGTFPLREGLFFMGIYHSLIGIIEAVITVLVILLILRVRPDLIDEKVRQLQAKGATG
jgi:cobalt/nickel transport system permease protein